MRAWVVASLALGALGVVASARAADVAELDRDPVRLDVTETTIVAQRFGARDGESFTDQGYGAWLNRLNAALRWRAWTVATRLDSAVYWLRPEDRLGYVDPSQRDNVRSDGLTRFRNSIYPAKLWATYQTRAIEATVGDAYVQFGRGLVLSMRKIDELGIDTTVRGGKITIHEDPIALTVVAGVANPSRVDEASGRALFLPTPSALTPNGAQPVFGSDRVVGAELQAGVGLPVVLTTHVARFTRCAPYRYDASGRVVDGALDAPFGSCDPRDTATWLGGLSGTNPTLAASAIEMVGQGVEVPTLGGHGSLYLEAAAQHRHHDGQDDPHPDGNALYGSFSGDAGPVTGTLEIKSYRSFYAVSGSVDPARAPEFANVAYTQPPTAELITQDAELGYFNVCVDGGRLRTDVRLSPELLLYGTGAYFHTKSEAGGGSCDEKGHTIYAAGNPDRAHDSVWDGVSGIEWRFDHARSHLFASTGVRDDRHDTGDPFYRELHVEYALTKVLRGPYSVELQGRHRLRREENLNARNGAGSEQPWREGEHYTALKIAPRWVLQQGIEYTTLAGLPTLYVNGAVLYRFSEGSNLRVLGGQQRGGLKCVAGVCRIFPPFEGVRAEITLRF